MRNFWLRFFGEKEKADMNRHIKSKEKRKGSDRNENVHKKIAVLILTCICLTSCSSKKINDAKKEVKKIPGYISNEKKSKITYGEEDAKRIARYVANGEKSKFINEMSKNVIKKKGSMKKVNALFSYMDGTNIKTRHIDETSVKDFTRYNFEFHNEKNHYYIFHFDFVPVDMNDAGNTGVRSFYIVEIEGWRKGTWSQRRIRKPVELYFHRAKNGTLNGTLLGKLEELFDWAKS